MIVWTEIASQVVPLAVGQGSGAMLSRRPAAGAVCRAALALALAMAASLNAAETGREPVSTNAPDRSIAVAPPRAPATNAAPIVASTNKSPIVAANTNTSTNTNAAVAVNTGKPVALDYSSFRVVAERNIFNADRTRQTRRTPGEGGDRPRRPQVSTISLVGYLGSPQGDRVFFDGTSSSHRKALKSGESLDEFKLTAISPQGVTLEIGDRKISLKIGEHLRREDSGPWEPSTGSIASNPAGPSAGTTASVGDGSAGTPTDGAEGADGTNAASTESSGADDVLQRLLKKRQQEENK